MGSARTALFLALLVSLALLTVATFEVLERVQAEPSDESVVAQQEGIRVVAEIRGSSNLGDSDGDGVPDSEDNCPAWPNADQLLPPWPVPDDDPDCDGFTTTIENWVGTLPDQHCGDATPNNESPQPWPTDNNDDTWSKLDDALRYIPVFNTFAPGPPYDQRFDLNADGGIGLGDVLKYIPVINKSCVP